MIQFDGAATGGQDTIGPVVVAAFLIESLANVGLRGGAIEFEILASSEPPLAATKAPMAATEAPMAATEAAPAAAETAPLEETPPRLLLFVVAFSLAAAVVVARTQDHRPRATGNLGHQGRRQAEAQFG